MKSASEDNLGLVQWDIGVLINCFCATIKELENYIHRFPQRHAHTPGVFLHQRHIILEQEILIRAIKLAIRDIVYVFGQDIDYTGLDGEAAKLCQRVWDMEII